MNSDHLEAPGFGELDLDYDSITVELYNKQDLIVSIKDAFNLVRSYGWWIVEHERFDVEVTTIIPCDSVTHFVTSSVKKTTPE